MLKSKPKKLAGIIFLASFLSLSSIDSFAGERSLGLFNSLKGFGISYQGTRHSDLFESLDLYADIYGFPLGRAAYYPGVKLVYLHNRVFSDFSEDCCNGFFYAGVGLSAGYVRDFEKKNLSYLANNLGFCTSVAGAAGVRFDFGSIALDLSMEIEAGLHLRGAEYHEHNVLILYKNGIYQSFYPQLKIFWNF